MNNTEPNLAERIHASFTRQNVARLIRAAANLFGMPGENIEQPYVFVHDGMIADSAAGSRH
jgi:hypothetical protein